MAAPAAMRQAFIRLQFSNPASQYLVDRQGLSSIEDLRDLDDDGVTNLCKAVRRPGGVQAPPAAAAGVAAPPPVPNPGFEVSILAETNLKLACYFVRHRIRIDRATTPNDLTMANIRPMRDLKEYETMHDDPEAPELDNRDWPRNIELIKEYFAECRGTSGIPLAYVIRTDEFPGADPQGGFESDEAEMIARARHRVGNGPNDGFTRQYLQDRAKVWIRLSAMCERMDCSTYIRKASRNRDGRAAYQALFDHYLGPNNANNLANEAERKLMNTSYNGEHKRFNFEKYCKIHVNQHAILEGLRQQGVHPGIDDRSKVRHLMDRIKTDQFQAVKTRIMSDDSLQADFTRAVSLFKDFLAQRPSASQSQVSSISTKTDSNSGKTKSGGKASVGVEDRYYKKDEYQKLSHAQRKKLKEMRENRTGKGDSSKPKEMKLFSKKFQRNIAALSALAKNSMSLPPLRDPSRASGNDSSSDSSDDDAKPAGKRKPESNRDNPALTRQKKSRK